jgi:hypothetical protein
MTETTAENMADELAKAHKMGSSEMTEKVGKLLRQAESLPEGSPEREAFMDRAMALSAAYSIDVAIARANQAKKERVEEPEERQYQVGQVGKNWRTPKAQNAHFVDLMLAICEANDLEVLISGSNVYVYAHGMPSDHEVAERMFAILAPQMVAEADKALKNGAHKEKRLLIKTERVPIPEDERNWGGYDLKSGRFYDDRDEYLEAMVQARRSGTEPEIYSYQMNGGRGGYRKPFPPPAFKDVPVLDDEGNPIKEEKVVSVVDARIWRTNFYAGFVQRTRQRLREAKKQAMKDHGIDLADKESSGALAILDKKKTVRASFEENNRYVLATSRKGQGYTGAEVSRHDYSAQERGSDAASRARIGDEKDLGDRRG